MIANKSRNIFSVILCLLLIVAGVLAGCDSPQIRPGNLVPVTEDIAAFADSSDEIEVIANITITGWYEPACTKNLMAFLAEKYPEYSFEYKYLSKRSYESLIDSQLSSKLATDIVMLNPSMTQKHAQNGNIEDLSRFCGDFTDQVVEEFSYEGVAYAVPSTSEYQCFFYNKDIFEKTGKNMPNNYKEYLEFCDYLYDEMRIKPMSAGLKNSENVADFALLILASGYFTTPEGSTFGERLASGEASFQLEVWPYMSKFQDMCMHHVLTKDMCIMDDKAAIEEFASGQSFMYMGLLEDYNRILEANPNIRLGTMTFNSEIGGKPVLVGGSNCGFAVNKYGKNKDMATNIVALLATVEGQRAQCNDRVGSQTFLKDVSFEYPSVFDPIRPTIADGKMYMPWYKWGDHGHEIYLAFGDELQKVINGERSMKVAFQVLDDKIDILNRDN